MSDPAQKRSADAPGRPGIEENTGLFAIEASRRNETVLPPAGEPVEAMSVEAMSPDEAVVELEPDAMIELEAQPARGLLSGVFSKRPRPPVPPTKAEPFVEDPGIVALANSLEPYYREQERRSERARLEVEDLSLRPDNPYAASSLVPPPAKPFPVVAFAAGAAVALVLLGGAWLAFRASTAEPQAVAVPDPAAVVPAVASAPASPPAAVNELDQRPRPVVTEPETPAPASAVAPTDNPKTQAEPQASERAGSPLRAPALVAQPPSQAATREPAPPREPESVVAPAPSPQTTEVTPSAAATAPSAPTEQPTDAPAVAIALPETPTREQVAAGFQAVREQLAQCAAGRHGVAQINATIANSGRVSYALIEGEFQGTPEGSCMARAVRTARFPQFSQPNLKVSYPVVF